MPMTRYSKDLRERAIKYLLSGHSYRETAKTFNVGTPALGRWKKMLEEQGDFQDKPCRKFFRKIDPKKFEEYIGEHPDAYLREIAEVFACSIAAVSKALKSMGYSKKKERYIQRAGLPKSSRVSAKNKGYTAGDNRLYR